MTHQDIARYSKRLSEGHNVVSTSIEAVIEIVATFGQSSSSDVQNVCLIVPAKTLSDKPPRDRWTGDTRYQYQRSSLFSVTQIMLSNAVRINVGSVQESAAHDEILPVDPFFPGLIV